MKKRSVIIIITILAVFLGATLFVHKRAQIFIIDNIQKDTRSNIVDNFYIDKILIEEDSVVFDMKKVNKKEKISLSYGYDYSFDIYKNNKWEKIETDLMVVLVGFMCDLDGKVSETQLSDIRYYDIFVSNRRYRLVKEVNTVKTANSSCYNLYSEVTYKNGTLKFLNKNSIEKVNCPYN